MLGSMSLRRTLTLANRPNLRHGALVLAIVALLALALPALAAASTTTLDFEGLAPGTKVSDQFDSLGIDFATGVVPASVGENVACYPVVTDIGPGAHSGTQVGDTSCANGEFPDSSLWGNLTDTATAVSAYVGFAPPASDTNTSATVTLAGYDTDGAVVADSTVTVAAGGGTETPLSISSGTPNIVSFGISSVGNPGVQVDDVSFDVPAGLTPDFGISAQNGSVQPTQGGSTTDQINIRRANGSTGSVSFSASGLPDGVHASFTPNPATSSTTMTISADPSAAALTSGAIPSFTVTATPDSSTVGTVAHSINEQVEILPVFSVNEPSVQVPPCSTLQVPITVHAPAGYNGALTLSASGGPSDDQASFSPATLNYPAQTQATLTIASQSDVSGPSGVIAVTVTGDNGISDTWHVPVSRVAPSITSVSGDEPGDLLTGGLTPQGGSSEGTIVVVHGQGFCPGSTVYFGNAKANASGAGPITGDGLGPYDDETAFRVYVPSLATSGKVYVVPPGGNFGSVGTASAPFTVDNYRDTDGFAFVNSDKFQSNVGGYSWDDIVDVFGYDATHISINACWPFGNCSFTTGIPDPLAAIFWGIADATLGSNGQCFGFSLASQRLLDGQQSFSSFPLQPSLSQDSVWNLAGPDPGDGSSGASASVAHFIHLMHVEQLSRQALSFWLEKATGNAINGSQTSLMNDVTSALAAGDHPLVEIRSGTDGHVVVAYAVDQADGNTAVGPGDRVIDVYNPNQPYTAGENNTNGNAHQQTLASSQIIVHSDGHWVFNGGPDLSGGPGSMVVMPASTIPVQPSLPLNVSDIIDVTFGSAAATQVSAPGGHDLLGSDGSINNNAKTGIPGATQFAPLTGTDTPGPSMFLFGHSGAYTTTVQGSASGQYHQVLLSHDNSESITAAAGRADTDTLTTAANLGGLRFGQSKGSGGRHASIELVGHGDGGELTATVATTVPTKGQAGVSFTGKDSGVDVAAGGQATSATLTLTWAGKDGLPQTFQAPALKLAAGDEAAIAPSSWSALASGSLAVSIRHRNGRTTMMTVHNRIRPANRYSVALAVARKGKSRTLQVRTDFTKLAAKSEAVITFEVLRGRRLVAKHVVSLSGKSVHRGLIKENYAFKPGSMRYSFRATVAVLSPTKDGGYVSQRVVHAKQFS
jgi:hypothetical protein